MHRNVVTVSENQNSESAEGCKCFSSLLFLCRRGELHGSAPKVFVWFQRLGAAMPGGKHTKFRMSVQNGDVRKIEKLLTEKKRCGGSIDTVEVLSPHAIVLGFIVG